MHFMLQKEVVKRMCSTPGKKSYGRLSIMLQYFCYTEELFLVPPTAFSPEPKVDSQIIRLIPYKEKPFVAKNYTLFSEVVKAAFSQRRKTLRNTLKKHVDSSTLINIGINPTLRAEQITVEQFVLLSNEIEKAKL
jgi:16S rRNA (adenine1518-N6/adenine1519-N6)-dimethyltransferase